MAEIYQIGSGMIGQAMALDLAENHKIHLADLEIENVRNWLMVREKFQIQSTER